MARNMTRDTEIAILGQKIDALKAEFGEMNSYIKREMDSREEIQKKLARQEVVNAILGAVGMAALGLVLAKVY